MDPFGLCRPKDNDPCNLNTGDPNIDDPTIRQSLEDGYKGAPNDSTYPGYKVEVGGFCTASACTSNAGDLVSAPQGRRPAGAKLQYHTHPNSNMQDPRQSNPNIVFDDNPSPADKRNANYPSRAGLSSYIVTPHSIHRLTPDGQGGVTITCFQRWNNSTAGCQP